MITLKVQQFQAIKGSRELSFIINRALVQDHAYYDIEIMYIMDLEPNVYIISNVREACLIHVSSHFTHPRYAVPR